MSYTSIGCRNHFLDWIWIFTPRGFEYRRARVTHEIAWPEMDKTCASGRIEQDNKVFSVVIPIGCKTSLQDVIAAVESEFGSGYQFSQFTTKG